MPIPGEGVPVEFTEKNRWLWSLYVMPYTYVFVFLKSYGRLCEKAKLVSNWNIMSFGGFSVN